MRELSIVPTFSPSGEIVTIVITSTDPIQYKELAEALAAYAENLESSMSGDLDA